MKGKNLIKNYVITTYIVFWMMVLGLCGTASMVFHASPLVMRILSNICAWSPTIVLLMGFKKFKPNMKISDFIKESFRGKVHIGFALFIAILIVGLTSISAFIDSNFENVTWSIGTYSIWASFLLSLTSGPTGEELGWRGYLRVELEKKYPFIKACIIQGLIWTFWHTVLWFVDSDFMGLEMIPYIISNVVVMTSLAIIMSLVLKRRHNLFYAILIHFSFNFPYCFIHAGIGFYIVMSIVYAIATIVFYKIYNKRNSSLYKMENYHL